MPNLRNRFPARRRFLKQSAALTATASLAAPLRVVAQTPSRADPQGPAAPTAAPAGGPNAAPVSASAPARGDRPRAPRSPH